MSKVPGLGFGEIHPTFLRRLLCGDLLSLVLPIPLPLLFFVGSGECVSLCVFGSGCAWHEIVRAVTGTCKKDPSCLFVLPYVVGAAVGSGWQDLVWSHGGCLIESSYHRVDDEAESVLIERRWIWQGNMADLSHGSSFYKIV